MLNKSFRIVTARLIPQGLRRKQALLSVAVILAGCGGSGEAKAPQAAWQTVRGPGFTFEAPAGWQVGAGNGRVSATHGSQLVQVARFSLMKRYDDKLFAKVAKELQARMLQIVNQTGGTAAPGRIVTVDGMRSHAYDVTLDKRVDEYTFVFSGMQEYLLLCRRGASDAAGVCARLATSFARA